jgi:transcriptional regulator with PAS, ATPase and Fis domain
MEQVLISWVGGHDLSSQNTDGSDRGPVISTLKAQAFDRVELLYNYPSSDVEPYLTWLTEQISTPINARFVDLSSPIHFGEIYQSANNLLAEVGAQISELAINILISPGTPAMQAVWILLGKTRYPATFWQSSKERGVEQADIPFDIAAEYLPAVKQLDASKLAQLAASAVPETAAFDDIITRNPLMLRLKQQAAILAERPVPVLIYGESGTGKELFARAIHNTSPRKGKPFVAVNCGAFPAELVDSILFGHTKGAFTGASGDKPGVFAQADGGTLFLDEFGELEPAVQVRLLRVLQEGSFTPVGATAEQRVDVRILAATNKDLMAEVSAGRFREDLFYRVAVGVLHLPPLRERDGDLMLLAETVMAALVEQDPQLKGKNISPGAKNAIIAHGWPGNIRELHSTLMRASLWSASDTIEAGDLQQAFFKMPEKSHGVLGRDVAQGLDLQGVCDQVMRHYITRTLEHTQGKKKKAAELLGVGSYQNLSNLMVKLNIS